MSIYISKRSSVYFDRLIRIINYGVWCARKRCAVRAWFTEKCGQSGHRKGCSGISNNVINCTWYCVDKSRYLTTWVIIDRSYGSNIKVPRIISCLIVFDFKPDEPRREISVYIICCIIASTSTSFNYRPIFILDSYSLYIIIVYIKSCTYWYRDCFGWNYKSLFIRERCGVLILLSYIRPSSCYSWICNKSCC